ncbi:hypothetical protein [Deinococcus roseus]|uniref:Lipoprotein n=1 Tax=Deinococcus roseus TaxID=392414 RepID=A0ABQ2DCF2_9DEIO|nr:hypothetical protein [Deinococcus roseus]GGJ51190.1 hypothetical protein GCM10008938_41500 [Deinococcus roseus]
MKKHLPILLVPLLASCGFDLPRTDPNAWLAFNQDFKNLSYNQDRTPAQRFFDVHFQETAEVHLSTDAATLNNQNITLVDLADQSVIPLNITLEEHQDPLWGVMGRYALIKSSTVLKYNHSYRLKAGMGIKTEDGHGMLKEESYDFQTEKEPLMLAMTGEAFEAEDRTYHVQVKNTSAFASAGLIFKKECFEPSFREYHAYLSALPAGASVTIPLKLIGGDAGEKTPPSACKPLQAYDYLAEREIQVQP